MMWEAKFTTEQAWPNGPLRRKGSGSGLPSKYVCGRCKRSAAGVYSLQAGENEWEWLCQDCMHTAKLSFGHRVHNVKADNFGHPFKKNWIAVLNENP